MPSCPRCEQPMRLARDGILRCDEHGLFVPASAFRREVGIRVHGQLRGAIAGAAPGGPRCPACLGAMLSAHVPLKDDATLELDGCPACGGWWLDGSEMERLRAAALARRVEKPRPVGGYGNTATNGPNDKWLLVEGLFGFLQAVGAFV